MKTRVWGHASNGLSSGERVGPVNCLEAAWRLFAATGEPNFYLLYKEMERIAQGKGPPPQPAESEGEAEISEDL